MLEIGAILGPARVQEEKRNDFVNFLYGSFYLREGETGFFYILLLMHLSIIVVLITTRKSARLLQSAS